MTKHIIVLDVGFAHCVDHHTYKDTGEKSKCQMRLVQSPSGYWYCVDCGAIIVQKSIEIQTEDEHTKIKETQYRTCSHCEGKGGWTCDGPAVLDCEYCNGMGKIKI